jgi:hypothetical protein
MQALADARRGLVAWAWAVNGCASVAGATLATLLAIHLGLRAVGLLAAALYLTAPLLLGRLRRRLGAQPRSSLEDSVGVSIQSRHRRRTIADGPGAGRSNSTATLRDTA